MTVEIHSVVGYGRTVVVARLNLADDGTVDFSEAGELEGFLRHFVCGLRRDGQFLTHEDGAEWLRLLPVHLRGTYRGRRKRPTPRPRPPR